MKLFPFLLALIFLTSTFAVAQNCFPFRDGGKWGLIDENGKVVIQPAYEAIGRMEADYVTFQLESRIGLLDHKGDQVLEPIYGDIAVLDSSVFLVRQGKDRVIVSDNGRIIHEADMDYAFSLGKQLIQYQFGDSYGVVNYEGKAIVPPFCRSLELLDQDFLLCNTPGGKGLWSLNGICIADTLYDNIKILDPNWLGVQKNGKWHLLDNKRTFTENREWTFIENIHDNFLLLSDSASIGVFVKDSRKVIALGAYDSLLSYSEDYILTLKDQSYGLIDSDGNSIISPEYEEIESLDMALFRVRKNGLWGLLRSGDQVVVPIDYNFIGPLTGSLARVSKNKKFGVVNILGELVVPTEYEKIEITDLTVHAVKGKKLELIYFDEDGREASSEQYSNFGTISVGYRADRIQRRSRPVNNSTRPKNSLENFEWFFHQKARKWGLRTLDEGKIIIPPTYTSIDIKHELGFTVVAYPAFQRMRFDRTEYTAFYVFGIIDNKRGLPITPMNLRDIRFEDIERDSLPVARVVFNNGRHGLINRKGMIIAENFTYIGEFKEGKARMSLKGNLSVTLDKNDRQLGKLNQYLLKQRSASQLESLTSFDQEIDQDGNLYCEDCLWGYIDTTTVVQINPAFDFVRDFRNKVAIVYDRGKWGALDSAGKELLPLSFNKVEFVENADDQMLRVYKYTPKFGLLDSSGRIVAEILYEDILPPKESRIGAKQSGKWGFLNLKGQAVTDFEFERINSFSSGLASVRKNRKWGFIDKKGNEVIPFKFQAAGDFREGKAWVRQGSKVGFIDNSGSFIIDPVYSKAQDFQNGMAIIRSGAYYGLIDETGNQLIAPKYTRLERSGVEDLLIAGIKGGGSGLLSKTGKKQGKKKFEKIYPFSDGLALVRLNGQYGFIDKLGDLVIAANLQQARSFSEGKAAFQENGRWGFINNKGQVIVEPIYSKCMDYQEGRAVVYMGYRNSGLLDEHGKTIIAPSVDRILGFSAGKALVRTSSHSFYYITPDKRLYKGYYEGALPFRNQAAAVKKNGFWGLINANGMELIPPKFERIYDFENGYAIARIVGFSGITDLKGNMIIPPNYDLIDYAGNGLFRVEKGNALGYLDTEGEWLLEMQE